MIPVPSLRTLALLALGLVVLGLALNGACALVQGHRSAQAARTHDQVLRTQFQQQLRAARVQADSAAAARLAGKLHRQTLTLDSLRRVNASFRQRRPAAGPLHLPTLPIR